MNRLMHAHVGLAAFALAAGLALAPAAAWSQPAAEAEWTAPRTAWGDPDIGGVWNSSTVTPLERPAALADQAFLTEEEAAAIEQRVVDANARANAPSVVRTEPLPVGGNVGGYNAFWLDRGTTVVPTRRTSLVIDPPDGRLPPLTPEAQAYADSAERLRLTEIREGREPADSYDQFDWGDRCIWYRGVPSLPTAYNNNYHIVQTEDVIAILQEHIHDVRYVHLDGRPPIDERIAQFGGHSRGRWEGDTLVVETTGFGERAYLFSPGPGPQGGRNWDLSPDLRVVERFTRVGPGTLDYQFTMEDPNVWTRPWTGSSPWARSDAPMFEYACHEGNYGLYNILAGSRAEEARAAAAAAPGSARAPAQEAQEAQEAREAQEPGALALVGAQLIDATGAPPVPDSVVVVRDGRIVAAGPRDETPVPDGAETVDLSGKTVIPGLVNLHVHYRQGPEEMERQFRSQLHFGVTTARSIGSDSPEQVAHLLATADRADAPRAYTAGTGFSYPGGFNAAGRNAPTTPEEARELVRAQTALGVHFIKMWVNEVAQPGLKIPPEIRAAIIDEAQRQGAVPVAHIDEEADGRQLIEAGLRDFLHSTVRTFGPGSGVPMDDPDPSPEFLRMAREHDVYFTPTLSIVQNGWHFAEHPQLLDDPELRAAFERFNPGALARWDDPAQRAEVVGAPGFADRKAAFRQLLTFVKTLHDADVAVALGNDAGTPNVPFGWGMHHEMELYVEAGLTPMEAIIAATATGAGRMPPLGEADFGTIEAGKAADLIVLDADPLADIRNTLAIDRVMRRGQWVDRSGFASTDRP